MFSKVDYNNQIMQYVDFGIQTLQEASILAQHMVANNKATPDDMQKLLCLVKDAVQTSFNIILEVGKHTTRTE